MTLRTPLLVLALLAAACGEQDAGQAGGGVTAEAGAAADRMRSALQYAFVARDAAAIAQLFAEDAVAIEPDGSVRVGRPAIEARIAELLPQIAGYSIASHGFVASGDLAYDHQTFQLTLATEGGGEARSIGGHQLIVLALQPDRSWRIVQIGSWVAPASGETMHH